MINHQIGYIIFQLSQSNQTKPKPEQATNSPYNYMEIIFIKNGKLHVLKQQVKLFRYKLDNWINLLKNHTSSQ